MSIKLYVKFKNLIVIFRPTEGNTVFFFNFKDLKILKRLKKKKKDPRWAYVKWWVAPESDELLQKHHAEILHFRVITHLHF